MLWWISMHEEPVTQKVMSASGANKQVHPASNLTAGLTLMQEAVDIYDSISWIAEQPWCNGSVVMMLVSQIHASVLIANLY